MYHSYKQDARRTEDNNLPLTYAMLFGFTQNAEFLSLETGVTTNRKDWYEQQSDTMTTSVTSKLC